MCELGAVSSRINNKSENLSEEAIDWNKNKECCKYWKLWSRSQHVSSYSNATVVSVLEQ